MRNKNTASTTTKSPSPEQLLDVTEDDVIVDFKPNTKCITDLHLRALHPSLPVAFKVQTSSPLKFLVSPPRGILPSLSSTTLRVVLRPQPHPPPSFPRSRSDRFLILSSLSASQLDNINNNAGSSNNSNSAANSIRLKVFFGGPYLLRMAAQSGDSAAARLILRRQPHLLSFIEQPSAGPVDTWEPLHAAAAAEDCVEVRRILLDIGGAGEEGVVDVRDREGRTALLMAAASGAVEVVEMLVEMGADRAAVDAQGRTPLDVARENGHVNSSSMFCCSRLSHLLLTIRLVFSITLAKVPKFKNNISTNSKTTSHLVQ